MKELFKGVYNVGSAPRHCPGCGKKLDNTKAVNDDGHIRSRLISGWVISCPTVRGGAESPLFAPAESSINFQPRSGKPVEHA